MRGKHNKLGEGERKVRLGQDSLPNIAISVAETIYVVLPGPKKQFKNIDVKVEFTKITYEILIIITLSLMLKNRIDGNISSDLFAA